MENDKIVYCEECGEPINPKRLKVFPKTKWCVECAQGKVPRYKGVSITSNDDNFSGPVSHIIK